MQPTAHLLEPPVVLGLRRYLTQALTAFQNEPAAQLNKAGALSGHQQRLLQLPQQLLLGLRLLLSGSCKPATEASSAGAFEGLVYCKS